MVAYSFKKQFAAPIQQGTKTQTIRAPRKRHALAGESAQLYCGMRSPHCFKIIADPVITEVLHVEMDFLRDRVRLHTGRDELGAVSGFMHIHNARSLDLFAQHDGFDSWENMTSFWVGEPFEGVLINWGTPYLPTSGGAA